MSCMCPAVCPQHDCWAECYICGFEYPINMMQLHYKKERLVCCACADCPGFSDYLEELEVPPDGNRCDNLGQPVSGQGGQPGLPTIVPPPPTPPPPITPPGGGGGAECDTEWNYIGRGIFYGIPLNFSNTQWNVQANLRGIGFVTVDGLGNLIDVDTVSSPLTTSITITRVLMRVNEETGAVPCKVSVELFKNGSPTGLETTPVQMFGEKGFATGSVTFLVGDEIHWNLHFYDLLGNEITVQLGQPTSPVVSKRVCVTFEYTANEGLYIHPAINHNSSAGSPFLESKLWTAPTTFKVADSTPGGPLNAVGFNTPTYLQNFVARARETWNFTTSISRFEYPDGTPIGTDINFACGVGFPNPSDNTIQGPFTSVMDLTVDAITELNIDTVGRFTQADDVGDRVTIGYGYILQYEYAWAYVFPEHPRTQYILAGMNRNNQSINSLTRAPLCGHAAASAQAARVATPLMTKGKFHHFAFWSYYAAVVGDWRCTLMVDGNPLFQLDLAAGTRLTTDAIMFPCVDGETAWWEFLKLSGANENAQLGISCLLGPEGV